MNMMAFWFMAFLAMLLMITLYISARICWKIAERCRIVSDALVNIITVLKIMNYSEKRSEIDNCIKHGDDAMTKINNQSNCFTWNIFKQR